MYTHIYRASFAKICVIKGLCKWQQFKIFHHWKNKSRFFSAATNMFDFYLKIALYGLIRGSFKLQIFKSIKYRFFSPPQLAESEKKYVFSTYINRLASSEKKTPNAWKCKTTTRTALSMWFDVCRQIFPLCNSMQLAAIITWRNFMYSDEIAMFRIDQIVYIRVCNSLSQSNWISVFVFCMHKTQK